MRIQLVNLVNKETENARNGITSGIVIKLNSLQDKELIDALYEASQAGVSVKLIVRGMCSLRPARKGLSENIEVISIVGEFLDILASIISTMQETPKFTLVVPMRW
jgi:Polyphosphate kinase